MSGTFERYVTRYDWPMYREIGRLRVGESNRVAAPLEAVLSKCFLEIQIDVKLVYVLVKTEP